MEQEFKAAEEADRGLKKSDKLNDYFVKWIVLMENEEVEGYKFKNLTKMGQTTLLSLFWDQSCYVSDIVRIPCEMIPFIETQTRSDGSSSPTIYCADIQEYTRPMINKISNNAEREGQNKKYVRELTK